MKLTEKLSKKRQIYCGNAVDFYADEIILPSGKKAFREYLGHPGAVAILPLLENNQVILVQQHRFPIRKTIYEIPAGKIDNGETPISCARRELEEETGYRAKNIKKLFSFYPCPAFSSEILHIYLATNLKRTKPIPQQDEFIVTKIINIQQAIHWVKQGKLRDAKTVIAFTVYQLFSQPQFRHNRGT